MQLRDLEEVVRRGQFDVLMVKPFSPWAYIVFSRLNVGYAGHVVLAVGLMAWALSQRTITGVQRLRLSGRRGRRIGDAGGGAS